MRSVTVAAGLASPEAPLQLPGGEWLVVEMAPERGCLSHLDTAGHVTRLHRTGRPNGLVLTTSGDVFVAESLQRNLLRVCWADTGARPQLVADADEFGRPFLFPNDLCFGPDGFLYMTDSGLALENMTAGPEIRDDLADASFDGRLYRIDTTTGSVRTIESGLGHLNGLSFGPAGDLFVNDTISGDVHRYRPGGGVVGPARPFANVIDRTRLVGFGGPDGMAHDRDGNLYVAVFGQGEIVVLDQDGRWIDRLPVGGQQPTNIALSADKAVAYVTERQHGALLEIPALAPGLPLHGGPRSPSH